MGQYNQDMDRVLEAIFENPETGLKVRDISKSTKVPKSTVHRYLEILKKNKVIGKNNKLLVSNYTKFLKSTHLIKKLFSSGLIDYLEATLVPSCIIVFGSARKGEYNKESDIDIFAETTKKSAVDISEFEKRIKHKIQLFIESDINKLPKELFNNVANGIKLSGYLRLK